jgi:hypothetical protein
MTVQIDEPRTQIEAAEVPLRALRRRLELRTHGRDPAGRHGHVGHPVNPLRGIEDPGVAKYQIVAHGEPN